MSGRPGATATPVLYRHAHDIVRGSLDFLGLGKAEDHPDTREVLARLLHTANYAVRTANSVATAMQLAAAERFDVVVSDLGLPDGTGYELMKQLRDCYGIKGIALSGYGMDQDQRRSREVGFFHHVVKPVNVSQLVAVIQRIVSSQTGG